jgi:UDP-glucose/galactose:(glucosyl)LPS alpha-1,2-glucosyl/galactosyltransferase
MVRWEYFQKNSREILAWFREIAPLYEMKKMDVVFSSDANYMQHFCVAATSLLENNLENVNRIFLITDTCKEKLLKKPILFIQAKYKKKIICLKLDKAVTNKFKVSSHVSKAAYYRLFLPEILPDDIDKILYLDSDVIVNKDLSPLFQLDFKSENFYLFAVNEIRWQSLDRLKSIDLTGSGYFNSGVLLVNLNKWRTENITETLIDIALNYKDQIKFYDQDVLNIAFESCWGEIDYKFNTLNLEYLEGKVNQDDCAIIHYTGGSKPWHYRNRHPLKALYWHYLWKTPYRFYIPVDITFKNILMKLVKIMSPIKTRELAKV